MGLFNTLKEPVVLKEDSSAKTQLKQLEFYSKIAPESIKEQIEQDKKMLYYGIKGEEAIIFELKNSHMPMYIMHDLFFTDNDLTTQIDFLVITRKCTIVIECKNLFGNIEINSQGDFIRNIQIGTKYKKEGIYSPITQNQRHFEMLKQIRLRSKTNFLTKAIFEKYFDENYKSLVVLANPKTIINMKFAKKEIKEKIIKVDQLNAYIKKLIDTHPTSSMSDKEMKSLADYFLENSTPNTTDYTKKYQLSLDASDNVTANIAKPKEQICEIIENTPVYKALKDYRYNQSKKESIKPYYIYNNAQLEEIIKKAPRTLDDLKTVTGFGDSKCQKYGTDILLIIGDFLGWGFKFFYKINPTDDFYFLCFITNLWYNVLSVRTK